MFLFFLPLFFFEMECGVGGGKAYSNYIINAEIACYYNFRFHSCSFAIRVISIEQLTTSRLGPMECMEPSGKKSISSKEGANIVDPGTGICQQSFDVFMETRRGGE